MLFESYKDYEYDRKKLEVEQEFYTPQTTFVNAYQINLTYRDILPFIKDEDRRIKLAMLRLIVSYCKTLANEWKVDTQYYENYSKAIEQPNKECTHTFYFYQYLDEWSLVIYFNGTVYNYALSDSAKQKVKQLFKDYKDVEQMIQVHQPVTIAEADTTVMIKILYQICLKKELKVNLNLEIITQWRQQIRIVDLFLFQMHQKQLEMINKSKQDSVASEQISFNPDQIGEARSFASKSNKSSKSIKSPASPGISFEKELSRSGHAHAPNTEEMIELTQEEFRYMMQKFQESVISELQKIQPQDPTIFLQKYLKGNGELRVRKNEKGQEELLVNIKGDRLRILLQQYEKYYEQKINEQEYAEQQEKAKVQYQQYMQFQQLLNYYYQTDPDKYSKLVQEYYRRLNHQTLKRLEPLLQQPDQQKTESSFQHKSLTSLPSPLKQNISFQNDPQLKNQPSFNVSLQNLSHQSQSVVKIDKQHAPSPFNSIIAQRYTRSITQAELNILMAKGQMTENSLNFFIRYLEEKQAHQTQETLRQFRIRTFFLSTTFYRALQPDSMSQAQSYTKKYIGRDNTIFDQFDIILIPIVVGSETIIINFNLAQECIIFYDTVLNGLGAKSMASSLIAQNGLLTNPQLLNCLRFLEVEHNQKLMKPLSLLKWQVYYSPHEKLSDINQSNALAALLISQISSGRLNKQKFSSQLELAQFIKKLQKLYYQIGITKNRKNELNFELMPL